MAKALDGTALYAYFRRLGFSRETQEVLIHIRSSPPSRTPGARRGNMQVWYYSKKIHCIIKAESTKGEFPLLLTAEHDDDVLEVWDQPLSIPLEYLDKHGHLQRPMHTADYFVFRYRECGWVECKPGQELLKQAEKRPNRYKLDEHGVWRCPPGEAFAARYGLTYQVWSSDQINWAVQENSLFLEDYYQDLERLTVPETTLETLHQIVEDHPGITLADLHKASPDVPADLINVAIAKQAFYVDFARYRLSEPWQSPVFRTRALARASTQVGIQATDASPVLLPAEAASRITPEGRELLERASDVDLATALFRNRVIHPEFYDDDEQTQTMNARAAVPARTRQRWQERYRDAETQYGSGFLGLLPRYHNCGGQRKISSEVIALIHRVLEAHYDTVTRKPKRGAYGEYLKCSEAQHLKTVDQKTFYLEARRPKAAYDQTVVREGTRAAYA